MQPLYLNISSDKVYLSYDNEQLFLERNGIENELGKVLVQRWRKFGFSKAYVLNGPGGFTNLRIGSLCVNLLNALTENAVDLYAVSKTDLYAYVYEKQQIARYGIIYIGQKRNIWLWDFEKNEKIEQMNIEQLQEQPTDEMFLDMVYEDNYYPAFLKNIQRIDYHLPQQLIPAYIKENNIKPTKIIEANYMMGPNIG